MSNNLPIPTYLNRMLNLHPEVVETDTLETGGYILSFIHQGGEDILGFYTGTLEAITNLMRALNGQDIKHIADYGVFSVSDNMGELYISYSDDLEELA